MATLTKRAVDAAQGAEKPVFVWDGSLKGFGLLVLPSGVKSFIIQYRNAAGRSRRLTIGRYGVFTVDQARKEAAQLLAAVAKGNDPLSDRQSVREAPTVADLLDRYIADYVLEHNAESSAKEITRLVERHLKPRLGHLKIGDVGSADIALMHAQMRGTPRQANYALAVVSKALNLAELWRLRPQHTNPARGIRRYKENERKRFLTHDELGRLGAAMSEALSIGLPWMVKDASNKHLPKDLAGRRTLINATAVDAILLLLFTGARLSEILKLPWSSVDFAAGTIALPSHKGGDIVAHPVNEAVLAMLTDLKAKRRAGAAWVLPGVSDPKKPIAKEVVESAWHALRRHADLMDVRIHDLRHTVGTYAGATGDAILIRNLLRHKNLSMTSRYIGVEDEPLRKASEDVGERISAGLASVTHKRHDK